MLKCGIIGLPNVGKSTLFNALLKKQQAFVANYPFATIEPNVGIVPVPDERLEVLARIVASVSLGHLGGAHSVIPEESLRMPPIKPAIVEFVDIAGLVKGASEGAGLGNKFLSHIREVQIIVHVVRAFEDENVIRYEEQTREKVDPRLQSPEATATGGQAKSDHETIQTELILADIQTIENSKRKSQSSKLHLKTQNELIERIGKRLDEGMPAREMQLTEEEKEATKDLFLLSAKPEIVVLNVSEDDYNSEKIPEVIKRYLELLHSVIAIRQLTEKQSQENGIATSSLDKLGTPRNDMVVICAKIEAELAELSQEDQKQYLKDLGLEQSGLERLIQKAYETLGLISFLTAPASAASDVASARQGGKYEVRAWTVQRGAKAVDAAGVIHTDFTKNFIKAEVVSYSDFVQNNGWKGSRENGKARMEGKDYIVQDGDVIEFKIGT